MPHRLMVGTWTPPGAIYTVEFDEKTWSLELVQKTSIPEDEPISWMTFDRRKEIIYGASMKQFSSHAVENQGKAIHHRISHPIGGHALAADSNTNTRAIFVLAAMKPPYNVYGNPFYDYAGYGNVFSVHEDGVLKKNIQNYEYQPNSGVHGMVFDPTETYLYSADLRANKIWTHQKDSKTGCLTLVGSINAPSAGDHPRWVAIHPRGLYLYVLMEAGNRLAVYVIDESTHMPVFTHITYPLIPPGFPLKDYRSDVVVLSHTGKYLFATSRANSFKLTGHIAAFRLDTAGNILRQLFLQPTPTSGGHSNAISPCDFSDEYLALTDDHKGGVEIYRFHEEILARVARLDIPDPGFGMNAIWYD